MRCLLFKLISLLLLPLLPAAYQMASLGEDDFIMVDLDGSSHRLSSPDQSREDYLSTISQHVAAISDGLRNVSLEIHDHPELKYHEFHAHDVLTRTLESLEGWKVTKEVGTGVQLACFVAAASMWMLLMTAAYFHTWFEKFTGFLVASSALYFVYFLPRAVPALRAVLGMPGV